MADEEPQKPPFALALVEAGLSAAEVADKTGVAERSVHRWIAGERTPRRDERTKLSLLVGRSSSELWPEANDTHQLSALAEWPNMQAVPEELWRQLIRDAQSSIDISVGSTQYFSDRLPDFGEILQAKRQLGQQVTTRLIFDDPDGESLRARDALEASLSDDLEPGDLISISKIAIRRWHRMVDGVDGVELRVIDSPEIWNSAIFRFDDTLLEYRYVPGRRGFEGATQQHVHNEVRGRFEGFVATFEWLWERGRPHSPTD